MFLKTKFKLIAKHLNVELLCTPRPPNYRRDNRGTYVLIHWCVTAVKGVEALDGDLFRFPANLPSFKTNKAYGLGNPRDLCISFLLDTCESKNHGSP